MKVKQLISNLKKLPPEATVWIEDPIEGNDYKAGYLKANVFNNGHDIMLSF